MAKEETAPKIVKIGVRNTEFVTPRAAREFLRGWMRSKLMDEDYAALDADSQDSSIRTKAPQDTIFDNGVSQVRLRKVPTVDIPSDPETGQKSVYVRAHWEIDYPTKTISAPDAKSALDEVARAMARDGINYDDEVIEVDESIMSLIEEHMRIMSSGNAQ